MGDNEKIEHTRRESSDASGFALHGLVPRSESQDPVLSFAQERLWFLHQMAPLNPSYNVLTALRLRGPLDISLFEQSIREVANQHEALRTIFGSRDGRPQPHIRSISDVHVELVDLRALGLQEREKETKRLTNAEESLPFDLSRDAPIRAKLLHLQTDEFVLLLCLHHIICDRESVEIVLRQLLTVYSSYVKREPSPLRKPAMGYSDFAAWQRNLLQGDILERQIRYWKDQLDGLEELRLPTDRPRPKALTFVGTSRSRRLPFALSEGVRAMGRNAGVTLFMVVLAAFQVLMSKYADQEDIAVGTPISNRDRSKLKDLVGFFDNTLVLRTDLSGNPSWKEVLGRVRAVALAAYENADLPFEKLVEVLHQQRDLTRNPLFQVLFTLEALPISKFTIPELELDWDYFGVGSTKFDLDVHVSDSPGGLEVFVTYSTDLFDHDRIDSMLQHYETLLEVLVAHPLLKLSEISLMSEAEKRKLLVNWSGTYKRIGTKCVHDCFSDQVQKTPEIVAAKYEGQEITYRGLDNRSKQIANGLRNLGVGLETPVAILLDRSLDQLTALLGVMRVGATSVPLDSDWPVERLSRAIQDTRIPFVLTRQSLCDVLSGIEVKIITIESLVAHCDTKAESSSPSVSVHPDNLAYIVFTSGSTGGPKAISLPHRVLINLIHWHLDVLTNCRRILQFAPLTFDASIHEIFVGLCAGATVFVASEDVRKNIGSLGRYIRQEGIEKAILPVVVFNELAKECSAEGDWLPSLKEVITTGEQMRITEPVVEMARRNPDLVLHNHYGPSETHVATAFTLLNEPGSWPSYPPIGKPIYNTETFVVDRFLNPVPVGVIGELCISGECLARGYANLPNLTAACFVPHPFSTVPGARLYRTGDRAFYRPDGVLQFVGRRDRQVKLRGFRIELDDIEAAIAANPAVREATVILEQNDQTSPRLVACVVPAGGQPLDHRALREYIARKLPPFMVPSAFVRLDEIPLNRNGKIDYRALSISIQNRTVCVSESPASSSPVEEQIGIIWAEILGLDHVRSADDFFELGGHSLLATQMIARINQQFGVRIPLRLVFDKPTVVELAAEVSNLVRTHGTVPPEKIERLHKGGV